MLLKSLDKLSELCVWPGDLELLDVDVLAKVYYF